MLLKSLLIISSGIAALYFYSGLRVREIAAAAARNYCQQTGVQFLDQSVSLKKIKLARNTREIKDSHSQKNGPVDHYHFGITIARQYGFEFTSTGDERYRGTVSMLGNKLTSVQLQAYRIPESADARVSEPINNDNDNEQT